MASKEYEKAPDELESIKDALSTTIDQELEILGWPRCLSAVPADVLDLI